MNRNVFEKKILKVLGIMVLLLLSILGLVTLIESSINYIERIKVINKDIEVVEIDKDYSKDLNIKYELLDNTDIFIKENNNSLSLVDILEIKNYIRKYTTTKDEFNTMISLYSVESNFHQYANSFLGAECGRGLGQVSEIALLEYNWRNKTNIQPNELYDLETNIKVSCWLLRHFQTIYKLDTIGTLMVYNKGINGYNKDKTDIRYSMKILDRKLKLDNV